MCARVRVCDRVCTCVHLSLSLSLALCMLRTRARSEALPLPPPRRRPWAWHRCSPRARSQAVAQDVCCACMVTARIRRTLHVATALYIACTYAGMDSPAVHSFLPVRPCAVMVAVPCVMRDSWGSCTHVCARAHLCACACVRACVRAYVSGVIPASWNMVEMVQKRRRLQPIRCHLLNGADVQSHRLRMIYVPTTK